jgi:hypothetical protein
MLRFRAIALARRKRRARLEYKRHGNAPNDTPRTLLLFWRERQYSVVGHFECGGHLTYRKWPQSLI